MSCLRRVKVTHHTNMRSANCCFTWMFEQNHVQAVWHWAAVIQEVKRIVQRVSGSIPWLIRSAFWSVQIKTSTQNVQKENLYECEGEGLLNSLILEKKLHINTVHSLFEGCFHIKQLLTLSSKVILCHHRRFWSQSVFSDLVTQLNLKPWGHKHWDGTEPWSLTVIHVIQLF